MKILIAIKAGFNPKSVWQNYIEPLREYGINIDKEQVEVFPIDFQGKKSLTAKQCKEIKEDIDYLINPGDILLVVNTALMSFITKVKGDNNLGHVFELNETKVVYTYHYDRAFYDPKVNDKIIMSLVTLSTAIKGKTSLLTKDVIHHASYVIQDLPNFLDQPKLAVDIEATALQFYLGKTISIAFADSEHSGISFKFTNKQYYAVRRFFELYKGNLVYHNATFDITYLIYHLYMKHLTDQENLLKGLDVLTKNFDCTKVMLYLCTNNTQGNELSLKDAARPFLGSYAIDVTNLLDTPLNEILEYNLRDTLGTMWLHNKLEKDIVTENQREIYDTIFKPSMVHVIQRQLTGLPINMEKVLEVEKQLNQREVELRNQFNSNPDIKDVMYTIAERKAAKANLTLKKITRLPSDVLEEFNPNSSDHLIELVYGYMGVKPKDFTPTKSPATGMKVLKKCIHQVSKEEHKQLLKDIIEYSQLSKILTAFIPAFKKAPYCDVMKWHFLMGNFNLGGTVSGRESSSNINLQQLPSSGSPYAKIIKQCFSAPKGWLLVGADFASLEDRISALATKDPNKLKVYAGSKQYKLTLNGQAHIITEGTIVEYDGKQLTGEQLYDLFKDNS